MNYLFILLGLSLLLFGGELLVRGAIALAHKLNISTLVIAFTVVAFGTSMPEMVVSLEAALSGSPSLAIGNVVGSNIANILLVLGLPLLIASITIAGPTIKRDAVFVLTASILLTIFAASSQIAPWEGAVLFLLIIVILLYSYKSANSDTNQSREAVAESDSAEPWPAGIAKISLCIICGLAGLFIGSKILIIGAIGLARIFEVPEAVIGLTLVAFGTSLPELATSIIAVIRKQSALVIGNVLGSNTFNTLGVAGLTAIVVPIPVDHRMLTFDFLVMIITVFALLVLIVLGKKLTRPVGLGFFAGYLVYVWAQFQGISGIPVAIP